MVWIQQFFSSFFSYIIKKLYKKNNYLTPYQINVECCERGWFFLQCFAMFDLPSIWENFYFKGCLIVRLEKTLPRIQNILHNNWESPSSLYSIWILSKLGFWEEKALVFFSDYYKNWDISHIWNKIITENKSHITKTAYNQWKGKRK